MTIIRFSPCVFLYLASVVPSVWLLELHRIMQCAPDPDICLRESAGHKYEFNVTTTSGPATTTPAFDPDEFGPDDSAGPTTVGPNELDVRIQ